MGKILGKFTFFPLYTILGLMFNNISRYFMEYLVYCETVLSHQHEYHSSSQASKTT